MEQYGLEARTVLRGRGALICETEEGLKIIREYWGSPGKMEQLRKMQLHCRESGFPLVDLVLENQEGQVVTTGEEGIPYIVRDWFKGRECDPRSQEDIKKSVEAMARLHTVLVLGEDGEQVPGLLEECGRHNRELRRIRKFLQHKKRKNEFEEKLSGSISYFLEKGEKTEIEMGKILANKGTVSDQNRICHGECNQHNILFTGKGVAFTNFDHWNRLPQICDLGQFMRKILEKYQWDLRIGEDMILSYDREKSLSDRERVCLKCYLSYPWKFWKLANFYTNSNKVWISQKNLEKLEQTIALVQPWNEFIRYFQ